MSTRFRRHLSPQPSLLSLSLTLFLTGIVLLWPDNSPILAGNKVLSSSQFSSTQPVIPQPIQIDPQFFHQPISSFPPPTRMIIPQVNLDLPVTESPVINGFWQLSDNSASHGQGSANPGQIGNIVIFAHARKGLFQSLRDVRMGMPVYLLTVPGWRLYQIDRIITVNPDQVEVVSPTSVETLTLYTCSGFADAQRLVVQAHPI